jgi:hypothetical protein
MPDHIDQTIAALVKKIEEQQSAISKIKTTINQLLELEGRPPMFSDADLQPATGGTTVVAYSRNDAFYGKPLATAVKMVLEARGKAGHGAATAEELYQALVDGGFDFEEKGEPLAKRNLAISLGKNMAFTRTPNGRWGLREWYRTVKMKKPNSKALANLAVMPLVEKVQDDEE